MTITHRKKWVPLTLAALLAACAAGGTAWAGTSGEHADDIAALANTKVTLTQAIAAAEARTGGKALEAGIDRENGATRIAVGVATGQSLKTVLVDPQTGQVTSVTNQHDDGAEGEN